jgi:CRP/FNR family transcriptional regulator
MVAPGAIVGLTAVLTNSSYESTVETLEPTHADFVRKAPFLNVLKTSAPLGQMVVRQFIHESNEAYATIRCLGVSGSVPERIARLLLHWAECPLANQNQRTGEVRIRVTLTHEEISQFVGSTRETTSRILGEFRKKKWIAAHGCIWTIADPSAIRRLAAV